MVDYSVLANLPDDLRPFLTAFPDYYSFLAWVGSKVTDESLPGYGRPWYEDSISSNDKLEVLKHIRVNYEAVHWDYIYVLNTKSAGINISEADLIADKVADGDFSGSRYYKTKVYYGDATDPGAIPTPPTPPVDPIVPPPEPPVVPNPYETDGGGGSGYIPPDPIDDADEAGTFDWLMELLPILLMSGMGGAAGYGVTGSAEGAAAGAGIGGILGIIMQTMMMEQLMDSSLFD